MDLRVPVDVKSGQLKIESKSEIFSAPGDANNERNNDKCVWCALCGTISGEPYNTLIIALKGAFQDLYKRAQKGSPEIALKGALQVALELHLFMQLPMHETVQYDSVKGITEEPLYAALESASEISFLVDTYNCMKSWLSTCQCNWECTWRRIKAAPKDELSNLHKDT